MILRLATANENGRRSTWPIVRAALRISRRPGIFIGDTKTRQVLLCVNPRVRVQLEAGVKFFRRYREVILFREIRGIRGGFLLITGHESARIKTLYDARYEPDC